MLDSPRSRAEREACEASEASVSFAVSWARIWSALDGGSSFFCGMKVVSSTLCWYMRLNRKEWVVRSFEKELSMMKNS